MFSSLKSTSLHHDALSTDDVRAIGAALVACRGTLAVAESCTGGQISVACTSVPGASAWFLEGVVTYANSAKENRLAVGSDTLRDFGAVSAEVCAQMAQGVRVSSGATVGLATTGIAGPTGGTDAKPVGTIYVALSAADSLTVQHLELTGTRAKNQQTTVSVALRMLVHHLQ